MSEAGDPPERKLVFPLSKLMPLPDAAKDLCRRTALRMLSEHLEWLPMVLKNIYCASCQ